MKYIKNFLLVITSLLLALLFGEMALRLKNLNMNNYDIEMWKYSKELKVKSKNDLLGHEHLISKCSVLEKVEICLDENGLRTEGLTKNFNGRKILFLGSSITLGWGVDYNKTMTSLIQNYFDLEQAKVQVINAGIGNYNTVRYVEGYFSKLKDLEATDIVVHYFINDSEELGKGNNSFLLRNSQLAATLWMMSQKIIMSLQKKDLITHYKDSYDDNNPGFIQMKASLKKLADQARKNNINLYLAMTPDIHFLEEYPFKDIHQKVKVISEDLGYTFIDLYKGLEGISFKELQIIPGDAHPNEIGHEIMAKTIYENIK